MFFSDAVARSCPTFDSLLHPDTRISQFLDKSRPQTPVLVVDLEKIASKFRDLRRVLPKAQIFYAVKANPLPQVLDLLSASDCQFDVASMEEIKLCLAAGISSHRLSFGNTIKKPAAIEFAHRVGVKLFAADCEAEVRKIARLAPGAQVCIRMLTSGEGAEWPLSRKFGCDYQMAAELLILCRNLGLEPWGVTFHVGSQQTDPQQWGAPIAEAAKLYREVADAGIRLKSLNLGGGFPASYRKEIPPLSKYAETITALLSQHFGDAVPDIAIEPGRCLVAEAGVIESEVVLISRKSRDGERWVYVDCGKFGGLAETVDEAIQYPITSPDASGAAERSIIAGPTCDSADILYEKAGYFLPSDLQEGDRIRIMSAGAYTHSYAAIGFNGFSPLQAVCI